MSKEGTDALPPSKAQGSLGALVERTAYKRAFVAICVAVFALAFLKGFRLPSLWAATHFAFNYSQGFVRRGLVGEIARHVFGDLAYKYNAFVVFAFVIFALTWAVLFMLMGKALRVHRREVGLRLALIVFGSSPALVFFIHTVGYSDFYGLLLIGGWAFVGLSLTNSYGFGLGALLLAFLLPFIHEALAVMFGALLVLAWACHVLRRHQRARLTRGQLFACIAVGGILAVALLGWSSHVSTWGIEDATQIRRLQRALRRNVDFGLRPEAFEALGRSSYEGVTKLMPWYWSVGWHRELAYQSWQAFAPGYVWLVSYGVQTVWRTAISVSVRRLLVVLFVAASVAPLFFNFVGWDWNRWNGLALVSALLGVLIVRLYLPQAKEERESPLFWTLGVIAAIVGFSSTTPLFDAMQVQFFPFTNQWNFLRDLFQGDFQYRPRG